MVSLSDFSIVLTGVSVSLAAIYYILTLRNTQRNMKMTLETRQTQLFMDLYAVMRNKEFVRDTRELTYWKWNDFEDFRKKYGSRASKEANSVFVSIGNFFDGIGVLVKRNLINPDLVDDLMSPWVEWYWNTFGSVITEYRKIVGPQYMEWVEYLYDRIKSVKKSLTPLN